MLLGGGGLLAACIQHYQKKKVKIVGVELAGAPAMSLSLTQGKRVVLEKVVGRAEGLLIPQVGAIPFQIAQQAQNLEMFLVSDEQIMYAIHLLWHRNRIRAEGAGAAALAAALRYPQAERNQKAVAIVSGGNIDDADFQPITASQSNARWGQQRRHALGVRKDCLLIVMRDRCLYLLGATRLLTYVLCP